MTCVKETINGKWRLESKISPEAADINPLERIKPCDLQKLINSLKL
jgi:hypothetical protein